MELDKEPLPCPFCGSKDVFHERIETWTSAVICNNCGARGAECDNENEEDIEAQEKLELEDGHLAATRAWNTRADTAYLAARPGVVGGDLDKIKPADNYKDLLTQFYAMRTLINVGEKTLSYYQKKNYSLSEVRLDELEKQLESEKAMNAQLTQELSAITVKEGEQKCVGDVERVLTEQMTLYWIEQFKALGWNPDTQIRALAHAAIKAINPTGKL